MNRKPKVYQEKPRMCDPGMCDHCTYVGDGNFICDNPLVRGKYPAIFVVENWQPNENSMKCKRRGGGSRGR